ncbi:MAG TPA: hypothetical protein VGQ78_08860 [Vicinamibacteria bacterium]|nr:hypothetical protein [Vicinamibacteria bacterium]
MAAGGGGRSAPIPRVASSRRRIQAAAWALLLAGFVASGCRPVAEARATLPPGDYTPREEHRLKLPKDRAQQIRDAALRRARVWREPAVPVEKFDFRANPPGPGAFRLDQEVVCRFQPEDAKGYSPKFHCVLPGGDLVKVKYGHQSTEVRTEVAATRLLSALGFGADRMYVVRKVRCFGCPQYPYPKAYWAEALLIDFDKYADFDFVAIERTFEGRKIATDASEGWSWAELDRLDPRQGASPRAEVDALRLMAVFLNNWDNKDDNNRLVCLPGEWSEETASCSASFALIHDVGSGFGPRQLDLEGWRSTPVWADEASCRVSMRALPYQGVTFGEPQISEAGRQFLARRLRQLSDGQLRDLFVAARFTGHDGSPAAGKQVDDWVRAFDDRVRQIADRAPCPR